MALPMTDGEFVMNLGSICPICGVEGMFFVAGFYVNGDNKGVQPCFCGDCGKVWNSIWELKGYERVG